MDEIPRTDRTTVRRLPARGSYDRALIHSILDEALICHVGFIADGRPFVIPTLHVRVGDRLYMHGSPGSRMLKAMAGGVEVCVTVTLVDGLVLARSAFHHSMNYRSVVVFGRPSAVDDPEEKTRVLEAPISRIHRETPLRSWLACGCFSMVWPRLCYMRNRGRSTQLRRQV